MVSPLLDRALARFDFLIRDLPERGIGDGFRFASLLDDTRSIGLLLEDLPYHLITMTLSLADGGRAGEMLLALPLEQPAGPQQQIGAGAAQEPGFAADLGQTECELQAVLGRRMVTLSEVIALEPGQLLHLSEASLAKVSLRGIDGKPVAMARLGQQNGHRALRISTVISTAPPAPPGPAFDTEPGAAFGAAFGAALGPAFGSGPGEGFGGDFGAGGGDHGAAQSCAAPDMAAETGPDFGEDGLNIAPMTDAGTFPGIDDFPGGGEFGADGGGNARIPA